MNSSELRSLAGPLPLPPRPLRFDFLQIPESKLYDVESITIAAEAVTLDDEDDKRDYSAAATAVRQRRRRKPRGDRPRRYSDMLKSIAHAQIADIAES